ncbi:hypothetical protein LAZ67_14002761 [Cordylochernes scorpioides]|uniref:Uncharacterized protein n=1 Tax=Cordylochernes scorpioides TaxID=51811 RepID=A0ABY6LC14_9ARAC|nr:hypothetical protein LAZ67_14002761 [Cordylochernes scorpioides]
MTSWHDTQDLPEDILLMMCGEKKMKLMIERTWPYIFRNDEKEQTLDSPQFQPHPNRESKTSIFGFSGTTTLVSYVPKK